ncbi:hypothetical protein AAP_05558 [Ascosphaera apis ARSEF 7405]|uniref:Uncharacterized protein n=1 Tax=Ascosphaera apis ARSEF 7405 TaxID=392613 RepID=A0A167VK72_9EURO|nr:hypothetical protein AAP_05558 [Ascosphaera apis ARSEF 7405]
MYSLNILRNLPQGGILVPESITLIQKMLDDAEELLAVTSHTAERSCGVQVWWSLACNFCEARYRWYQRFPEDFKRLDMQEVHAFATRMPPPISYVFMEADRATEDWLTNTEQIGPV